MKKVFTLFCASVIVTGSFFTLSSFSKNPSKKAPVASYSIQLQGTNLIGTSEEWIWMVTNPNPGNGQNGTLQDISHWSVALPPAAEAALVSAAYSRDGVNWHSAPTSVDRDPSIKFCTNIDVLKFDVGSNGTDPVYFKAVFNKKFATNPYSTSWIKTGGGMQGCNVHYFAGMGGERFD